MATCNWEFGFCIGLVSQSAGWVGCAHSVHTISVLHNIWKNALFIVNVCVFFQYPRTESYRVATQITPFRSPPPRFPTGPPPSYTNQPPAYNQPPSGSAGAASTPTSAPQSIATGKPTADGQTAPVVYKNDTSPAQPGQQPKMATAAERQPLTGGKPPPKKPPSYFKRKTDKDKKDLEDLKQEVQMVS